MIYVVCVISFLVTIAGLGFAVWTYIDTRKKYYIEFMKRKSEREKLHLP